MAAGRRTTSTSMELCLLTEFDKTVISCIGNDRTQSSQALKIALSLFCNPFTSHTTLHSLFTTLNRTLQNQNPEPISHHHILAVLSVLLRHHPRLCHEVCPAIWAFALSPSTPTPYFACSLSILFNNAVIMEDFADESVFLSFSFRPCKPSTRHWLLRNVNKFNVRPSLLLTVLLGFTNDPFPYTREAALDGLALLCKFLTVGDQSFILGCYFRAVELLFDSEDSVRCSAVRAV